MRMVVNVLCGMYNVFDFHFALILLSESKGMGAVRAKYFNPLDRIFLSFSDPDCWECSSKENLRVKLGRKKYGGIKQLLPLWICNPCECELCFW